MPNPTTRPELPRLPAGFNASNDDWLGQIAGSSNRARCIADIEEYGRACYAQALEEAATLIETTRETTTIENGGDTQRHLTPRKMPGDLTGMTWAAAIRALIDRKEPTT